MTQDEKKNGETPAAVVHGSGSVAHQIIGEFLDAVESDQKYGGLAKELRSTFFEGKPSEMSLRLAMFGVDDL